MSAGHRQLGAGRSGFTLIEVAIAVAIIGLLVGGLLVPLQARVEERKVGEAQKAIDGMRDALIGFAAVNGYLPCPDRMSGGGSNDGVEDASAGFCSTITGAVAIGNVPWATLGISDTTDPWGNRYRYAVIENFARRSPQATFSLGTTVSNALRICATSACTTQVVDAGNSRAVAVILSHGANGWGAVNWLTNATNTAPTSADEIENADSDGDFVYRTRTASGATAGEFDDIVTWVPRHTLLNRMVSAGTLH